MKIVRFVVKIASYVGVSAEQSSQKVLFNRKNVSAMLVLSLSTISSLIHLLRNANTFTEYTYAVAAFSSMFVATAIHAIIVWEMKPIFHCLDLMENKAFKPRLEYAESKALFDELDLKVEKWTKFIYFINMKIFYPFAMFARFVISYQVYFLTDSGNDAFELVLPFWFPFDWKNPIGYFFAMALQSISMFYVNLVISASVLHLRAQTILLKCRIFKSMYRIVALCTGVGVYMWSMIYLKDVKNNLNAINGIAGRKKQRAEFRKTFFDTVYHHSVGVELLNYGSTNIAQPVFMLLITWGITTICGAMLIMNTEISQSDTSNWIVFLVPIIELFWSFGLVFITCELAGRMSYEFDEMDYIIGQFKWYLFPFDVQQLFPMVIINAHQEVAFQCFGSIMCDRETFKKVVNHSYSYFMVLKNF